MRGSSTRLRVFISYRRSDAFGWPGRIHDAVAARLPNCDVFRDIDNIPLGADFTEALEHALHDCDVLLALIGPDWLSATDATGRRLDSPNDYLRRELEAALSRGVLLIPILLEGARIPEANELPGSLESISRSQALQLSDAHFNADVTRLCARLTQVTDDIENDIAGRSPKRAVDPTAAHVETVPAVRRPNRRRGGAEVGTTNEPRNAAADEPRTFAGPTAVHREESVRSSPKSRRRPRRRVVVVAGVAAVVGILGAFVLGGGSQTGTESIAAPVTAHGLVKFASVILKSGVQLDRSWRLSGPRGDELDASLTVTNITDKPRIEAYEEVIPKELAANVSLIRFAAPAPVTIKPDPVVQYTFVVPAGKTRTVRYAIAVAAEGTGAARLDVWKAAWVKAVDERTKERAALASFMAAAGAPAANAVSAPGPATTGRPGRSTNTGDVSATTRPSVSATTTTQATIAHTDWPAPGATGGEFNVTIGADGWSGSPYNGWRLPVGQGDTAPGGHDLSLVSVGPASYGTASSLNYRCGSQNSLCAFYHTCFNGTYDATFPYTIRDVTTGKTATATITVHVKISDTLPPTVC